MTQATRGEHGGSKCERRWPLPRACRGVPAAAGGCTQAHHKCRCGVSGSSDHLTRANPADTACVPLDCSAGNSLNAGSKVKSLQGSKALGHVFTACSSAVAQRGLWQRRQRAGCRPPTLSRAPCALWDAPASLLHTARVPDRPPVRATLVHCRRPLRRRRPTLPPSCRQLPWPWRRARLAMARPQLRLHNACVPPCRSLGCACSSLAGRRHHMELAWQRAEQAERLLADVPSSLASGAVLEVGDSRQRRLPLRAGRSQAALAKHDINLNSGAQPTAAVKP